MAARVSDINALVGGAREVLLKLADEELVVGHILSSQAGWCPELEVNIVVSSAGQEELGHARLFYGLLYGEAVGAIDRAIYERDPAEFRSSALAERYSQDWAELVVKQYLYDTADAYRLKALGQLGFDARLLARINGEEEFQREFWRHWIERISSATASSRARVQAALDRLWPIAGGPFEVSSGAAETDAAFAEAGELWRNDIMRVFGKLELGVDDSKPPVGDGDRARILSEMRSLYNEAPGRW